MEKIKTVFLILNIGLIIKLIFWEKKETESTWAWILVLFNFPLVGFLLYMLTGQNIPKQKNKAEQEIGVLTEDNYVEVLTTGEEKFQAVFMDIQKAKKEILVQYYIFKEDFLFHKLKEALCKKSLEGVKVKVLYDGLGSRKVSLKKWDEMRKAGVEVKCFKHGIWNNLLSVISGFNYRNHRKILIVDGYIGYLGGYNVGKEYLGMDPKFGFWRDTHFRIVGSAVSSLRKVFFSDWGVEQGEKVMEGGSGGCGVQMVISGPSSASPHIRNVYLRCIGNAKKKIQIQTPYFIPDGAVLNALKLALLSGKEVQLMLPKKPDHMFVYWASLYYAAQLLEMGAEVYIYQNGFLHTKGMIMDEDIYCYGTANMDIRSFHLNYEINAIVYGETEVKKMCGIFRQDLENCKPLTEQEYASRSLKIRIKEHISRLLSPLL